MARYTGPVCRLCRRAGVRLYLKGDRCMTPKCEIEKRAYPPGEHTQTRMRRRVSAYGVQLTEKQKLRRMYGVLERQFRRYFAEAEHRSGITGETLLQLLERRLDNVLYRSGLVTSRPQGRQWIIHGNVRVNGRRQDVPSYLAQANDVITLAADESIQKLTRENLEVTKSRPTPSWLEVSTEPVQARLLSMPTREEVSIPVQVQLLVELLSK